MTPDLFDTPATPSREAIGPASVVLRGWALPWEAALLNALPPLEAAAPLRHMDTPGGFTMSVALTNCGALGWVSDRRGYRYSASDPASGRPWPPMPEVFRQLAQDAAEAAGFLAFAPDACLVNRYRPGARLALHQDQDERHYDAPIVSISLGMAATFLFGGHARADKPLKVPLLHGDVVVWGGVDRLRFHGVMPLKDNPHPLLGRQRINLTLRRAG